jgi:hypothetical protein
MAAAVSDDDRNPPDQGPDAEAGEERTEVGEDHAEVVEVPTDDVEQPGDHSTELELAPRGGELGRPVEPSTYAPRFRLITGALVGIALGAVVATMLLLGGKGKPDDPTWSLWKPSADGDEGAQQIADHVGRQYRLSDGGQLVAITGGPLEVAELPVKIALAEGSDYEIVRGDGVLFNLCGLGRRCSIARGKPSVERFILLRREALELALYTFRYIDKADYVVVLMPPAPNERPQNAMYFNRDDVEASLDRPLGATLPPRPPALSALKRSPEATLIQRLTAANLFRFTFQQGQNASVFLVLQSQAAAND